MPRRLTLVTTLGGAVLIAACAGGGSGPAGISNSPVNSNSSGSSIPGDGSTSGGGTNNPGSGGGSSTGGGGGSSGGTNPPAFSVSPAEPASVGSNGTAQPMAGASAPNFFKYNSYPMFGTAFPLLQSAVRLTSTSLAPDTTTNATGATISYGSGNGTDGFGVTVPSLGIDFTVGIAPDTLNRFGSSLQSRFVYSINPFTYALPGLWVFSTDSFATFSSFTTGYQTPGAAMPLLGTATYRGDAFGLLFKQEMVASVAGDATLTVNFGTNTIIGSFVNMVAFDDTSAGWFNDIAISAQLLRTGSDFGGTTSAASSGSGRFGLQTTATGTVKGNFYGPNAQEVGAVWTLSDGTGTVIGALGATSAPLPTIAAPAPASRGATPQPTISAVVGGGAFDGSGLYPASVSFPANSTTLQFNAGGVSAVNSNQSATVIVDLSSATSSIIRLFVPAINLQQVVTVPGNLAVPAGGGSIGGGGKHDTFTYGLSYVSLGLWAHSDQGPFHRPESLTAYAIGYETPASAVPATGTAVYSGNGTVRGVVLLPQGVHVGGAELVGNASLTANFGTGSISGTFTGITADDGARVTPWNDISVNASIVAGTNGFNGTTQATTSPSAPYALRGTAAGSINGAFYGPNVENIGAVWSLSDGIASAVGGLAGQR
jgi:C-lobe and N-lobe beta barrels of Tf-binding protein B